jgi:hypothetical protein
MLQVDYDAFGGIGTIFRDHEWKSSTFSGRVVLRTPKTHVLTLAPGLQLMSAPVEDLADRLQQLSQRDPKLKLHMMLNQSTVKISPAEVRALPSRVNIAYMTLHTYHANDTALFNVTYSALRPLAHDSARPRGFRPSAALFTRVTTVAPRRPRTSSRPLAAV